MPRTKIELSPLALKRMTAPGLHRVGGVAGLALQITPTGGRSWIMRIVVAGKRRDVGLGSYPATTLAMAKEKAAALRDEVRNGADPIERRKAARSAIRAERAAALTFAQVADAYITAHEHGWKNAKHAQQWRNTLTQHAYPVLGDLLVRDVEKAHVLGVLEPIWTTIPETASRVRNRIELVLAYAMQAGYRPEGPNPARWKGGLDKLLAPRAKVAPVVNHRALPWKAAPVFMQRLRSVEGMAARCLQFAILTACRSGEARGATWAEVDLHERIWTIPAARMKASREHRVPLSDEAIELLRALPRLAGCDYVFPSSRGAALSDMALTMTLRRMEVDATTHGFRSTFRTWAAEATSYPRDVAEQALAHAIADAVEAVYQRGDMLAKRTAMMGQWARFLARAEAPAEVLTLSARRTRGAR